MLGSQSSTTAEYMALFRAQESSCRKASDCSTIRSQSRSSRRVFAWSAPFFASPIVRSALSRWMDARWPGARTSAIARTRLIDDWVRAAVTTGVQQVVILGAGFDCRAWRLPAFSGIPIFEIDYPATSTEKRRLIGKLGVPTEQVYFVPVDFERESLAEGLAKAEFRADKRTLVIWEGVTNYLTAEAVDATVRWVATLAEGSRLIFTYVDADLIKGSGRFKDAGSARRAVASAGEPWTFGFRPEELPAYLRIRGLQLVTDMSASEYRACAMGARGSQAAGYEFYHVAQIQVGS